MLNEREILDALDHANDGYYCDFIPLNHPYSYLIDTRLNLFRGNDEWAIVAEILGYNPRGGGIELLVFYYGNCLINLERYNNRNTNYYSVFPIDVDSFSDASLNECLNPAAATLTIREVAVPLSREKAQYKRAGIESAKMKPDSVRWEEVGRLLITQHQELFRATDDELYKSLPMHLEKTLVLDAWHHKDFTASPPKIMTDENITRTYELSRNNSGLGGMSLSDFTALIRAQEARTKEYALREWNESRPSSYETWQQLAKVLATGDVYHYQPTLLPNTHWSNWPDSGSL